MLLALLLAAVPVTLRVEYLHVGSASEERFALERVVAEGPWAGPADRRIDETNLGKYLFEVRDRRTNRLLYSRGFASIYGEWETTGEAGERTRAFRESLRFPEPEGPVQVVLKKRGPGGFREIWQTSIDPAAPEVDRTSLAQAPRPWAVIRNGEPADKVDLLLMGDGYTAAEMDKWHADAKRLAELLFAQSPFRERRGDFNVWAVDTPSEESGVARPSDKVQRRSALRAAYDAFGSERYVLVLDEQRLREAAAAAPYEFVEVVVNDRKYGGGGIFNTYATVSADNAFTPYVFVHEFGHHFAGLADEYYTSDVAYESGTERPEPWEENATADPKGGRWKELQAGAATPSTWPKAEFEALQRDIQARRRKLRAEGRPEAEMEALFREEREKTTRLLAPFAGQVGAFEGSLYEAKGYYRSQADCIMFTRDEVGFCAACRRALDRVIDLYASRRQGR